MKLVNHLDLSQNEIRNGVVQNLSSAPSAPKPGQVYFNTSTNIEMSWNGNSWRPKDAAGLADGSIGLAALAINPVARANHTGSQAASTISDLSTVVHAYTLDGFAAPAGTVSWGAQRLTALATATQPTDAVPLAQVQSIVTAAIAGQTAIKNPVRAYASGNITLSGTQTLDGVSLAVGDRVAAGAQTTASQNGIYVVATGAWSLAADANAAAEWLEGTEFLVAEGASYAGAIFSQTTASPTLSNLAFTQRNKINAYLGDNTTVAISGFTISAKLGYGLATDSNGIAVSTTLFARKFSATIIGDGTTTSFFVTHGLGTQDVAVSAHDSSNNLILADVVMTSTTQITIAFGAAPASGTTYRVTIIG